MAGRRVGNAVVRNRVKRRLREIIRALYPILVPGFDVILIARPGAAKATLSDLEAALRTVWSRARLWRVRQPDASPDALTVSPTRNDRA